MKWTIRTILTLTIIFFTLSCQKKGPSKVSESDKKEVIQSKFAKLYPNFIPEQLRERLESKLQNDSLLNSIYSEREYQPIWTHDTLDISSLNQLFAILEDSKNHGIPSDYFPVNIMKSITDSIDSGLYSSNIDTIYEKIAILELQATKAGIKYVTGMNYGFTNPKKLFKNDYDIVTAKPDSIFYTTFKTGLYSNPIDFILKSIPSHEIYTKLLEEYASLESLKEVDIQPITSAATFKIGDKSPHITEIANRLIVTGEYEPDPASEDTLNLTLNEDLLAAINNFRLRNSFLEEKEVGKLTIDALNRPISYYQEKIRANMERYRWKRVKSNEKKHIEVNVAPAMLFATEKDNLPQTMRVCVGSSKNKTPLLESNIGYLNLNPTWNVPTSIAQKEVAILQKKDPTYIKRHNMKLYKGGKEVDIESINWNEINPSKFSYSIRQNPGESNALGLIKFMFNNAYSVYLHDTPSKAAFNRKNRAVSHGCVRVQKPFDLAIFCLTNSSDSIYKDKILYSVGRPAISNEGKKLAKENKLKKLPDILRPEDKVSLSIDYYTVYMYPNKEEIYYADDIYDYDKVILKALESGDKGQAFF